MATAVVTLPDGRKAKITGKTKQDVLDRAEMLSVSAKVDMGRVQESAQRAFSVDPSMVQNKKLDVASEVAAREFLNNILAIPAATGDMLAAGGAALQTGVGTLTGQEGSMGDRFRANLAEQQQQFPARQLSALPRPEVGDFIAGAQAPVRAAGNVLKGEEANLGGEFSQAQLEQQARMKALKEQPGGTAGDIGGDVLTLLTGRAPISRARAPVVRAEREAAEKQFREMAPEIPERIRRQYTDVLSEKIIPFFSDVGSKTARGGRKSLEAAMETATLAALNDEDPTTAAMLGAGAQGAGSLGLFLAEKPIKRLLPVVGTSFVLAQMFRAVGPGEKNVFESFDFAVDKAVAAVALGTLGALTGAGRLRGPNAERFPVVFDAMTSIPRGVAQNRLRELAKESEAGNESPLRVLEVLASDPLRFTEDQIRSLDRALKSEKAGAFTKEVERLKNKSKSFMRALGEED